MGQPKRPKKKFTTPSKPWEKNRILHEIELMKRYGYKNKTEIWRMMALIRGFRTQARKIVALDNEQAKKEGANLIARLIKLGLLEAGSSLDNVLELNLDKISERRLVYLAFKKGLSRSVKQARQFITHRHIEAGGKVVTSPNYVVPKADEVKIAYTGNSPLSDVHHPLLEQMKSIGKEVKKEAPVKESKKEEPKKEETRK
jgi:small subunit ribosomal protein S4